MAENLNVKMTDVRIIVSYFAGQLKFRFLQAPEKGVKLDTKTAVEFAERMYSWSELPNQIFADCECSRHGLKQKMGDSLAMSKDAKAATSLKEAIDTLDTLWKQLKDGNWKSAVRVQAESIKLSDMEKQFHVSIQNGVMPFEQAAALYKSVTGKELPPVPATEEEATEQEVDVTEGEEK